MDARQWTGDDERDLSAVACCDQCGCELYPDERTYDRCRRCREDALEAGDDDGEAFRGGEAAAYEAECHELARGLK